VGPWLPCRGGRSYFRRDRFHRAHAYPGSVPGSTDFLTDRIHVGRTDALRGGVRLSDSIIGRIVGPGHISVGCVRIPVGVLIPAADPIRIREFIPVRLPEADPDSDRDPAPDSDPDPDPIGPPDPHPERSRSNHVRASIHADVSAGFVVERMPAGALSSGPSTIG
jgi:hypothetical protein